MRGTCLALALVAGALLAPATANASTFSGSCDFEAPYSFDEGSYGFVGDGSRNGTCSGTLNHAYAGYEVVWRSSGDGGFRCEGGVFSSGTSRLDFYRIAADLPGQPRIYVDSLDLRDGPGVAGGGRLGRTLTGASGGSAVEQGRLSGGACGSGVYRGGFVTTAQLLD